ncbi:hypothetical protein DY123_07310 [Apilactobacillus micheneri]|uniref:hypothetical protein n=1 Tax=Apilactobacillus micheneri TaxID=1899430 RepID=UPI00112AA16D|nr:hypothetical protein [Apilactobacillus micheneri]TPR41289.1 hypothetical protein DY123_07310 [Apilactobacillus micheneri]
MNFVTLDYFFRDDDYKQDFKNVILNTPLDIINPVKENDHFYESIDDGEPQAVLTTDIHFIFKPYDDYSKKVFKHFYNKINKAYDNAKEDDFVMMPIVIDFQHDKGLFNKNDSGVFINKLCDALEHSNFKVSKDLKKIMECGGFNSNILDANSSNNALPFTRTGFNVSIKILGADPFIV